MKKCGSVLGKLEEHRRFVMAVATSDVPRLHHLVRQSLKERAGVGRIVSRIEETLEGVYHARGYNADDHDIALLVLRLGGRRLLHAMSKYISLPSLRTLRRVKSFTRLMPSLGPPRMKEILFNIRAKRDASCG